MDWLHASGTKNVRSGIAVSMLLFAPLVASAGYPERREALRGGDVAMAAREFGDGSGHRASANGSCTQREAAEQARATRLE